MWYSSTSHFHKPKPACLVTHYESRALSYTYFLTTGQYLWHEGLLVARQLHASASSQQSYELREAWQRGLKFSLSLWPLLVCILCAYVWKRPEFKFSSYGYTPAGLFATTLTCIPIFFLELLWSYSPATGSSGALLLFHNTMKELTDILLLLKINMKSTSFLPFFVSRLYSGSDTVIHFDRLKISLCFKPYCFLSHVVFQV